MFLSEKTTQAAAKFVKMAGGTMPYIVLLKLLYVADRKMLLQWGVPMTYDAWYSMNYGPVLSSTYRLIRETPTIDSAKEPDNYWQKHLRKNNYDLLLVDDPGDDLLSEAEDTIIAHVFDELGSKKKWELVDWTHELPEWSDPGNSSRPITYETVLLAEGFTPDAIAGRMNHLYSAREITLAWAEAAPHEHSTDSAE